MEVIQIEFRSISSHTLQIYRTVYAPLPSSPFYNMILDAQDVFKLWDEDCNGILQQTEIKVIVEEAYNCKLTFSDLRSLICGFKETCRIPPDSNDEAASLTVGPERFREFVAYLSRRFGDTSNRDTLAILGRAAAKVFHGRSVADALAKLKKIGSGGTPVTNTTGGKLRCQSDLTQQIGVDAQGAGAAGLAEEKAITGNTADGELSFLRTASSTAFIQKAKDVVQKKDLCEEVEEEEDGINSEKITGDSGSSASARFRELSPALLTQEVLLVMTILEEFRKPTWSIRDDSDSDSGDDCAFPSEQGICHSSRERTFSNCRRIDLEDKTRLLRILQVGRGDPEAADKV